MREMAPRNASSTPAPRGMSVLEDQLPDAETSHFQVHRRCMPREYFRFGLIKAFISPHFGRLPWDAVRMPGRWFEPFNEIRALRGDTQLDRLIGRRGHPSPLPVAGTPSIVVELGAPEVISPEALRPKRASSFKEIRVSWQFAGALCRRPTNQSWS